MALKAREYVRRDAEVRTAKQWHGGGAEGHRTLRVPVMLE
jgi:hypothetical protein